ncbi:hypothetical protein [Photobacterium ganghwense]|uniref:hypothetical protein n=1 Tax=Photobacterium ganghwense TaxID=320778 RepID=UPI001A8E16A6|nr:hypothetical protein [Photobacterium ganghwense]QSV17305.1 hypothetical protein FH974_20470 [Photobacterium ganghwense]
MEKLTIVVITAICTTLATLVGVFIKWILDNVSKEQEHIHKEHVRNQEKLEENYIFVLKTLESTLRSKIYGSELDGELSNSSAIIKLCANKTVQSKFDEYSNCYHEIFDKALKSEHKITYIWQASEYFSNDWNKLIKSRNELAESMKSHIGEYDFYKVTKF